MPPTDIDTPLVEALTQDPPSLAVAPSGVQPSRGERGQASIPMTRDLLTKVQSISLLGQMAAKGLLDYGQITFFFNHDGVVEIAPTREVGLDGVSEAEAIEVLLAAGYDDAGLAQYLRGRDARREAR